MEQALDKIERLSPPHASDLQKTLEEIAAALKGPRARFPDRIASKFGDRAQLIDVARVSHSYADDKLAYAATSPRPVLIDATLNELEARLDPPAVPAYPSRHARQSGLHCGSPVALRRRGREAEGFAGEGAVGGPGSGEGAEGETGNLGFGSVSIL